MFGIVRCTLIIHTYICDASYYKVEKLVNATNIDTVYAFLIKCNRNILLGISNWIRI